MPEPVVIGNATLYLGDCLDILPTLGKVDAVITDPPYKLSQEYGSGADADNLLAVSSIWPVASAILAATKPGGVCAMFYDSRILPLALEAMRHAGWRYLRNLTLYRRWGQASLVHGWMSTSDFILLFGAPGVKPQYHGSVKHDVYVKDGPEVESTGHPAQKPIEHLRHIVGRLAAPGAVVLDPYMGSGTTGKACVMEGRSFVGIEREPAYFDMACRRIESAQRCESLFDPSAASGIDPKRAEQMTIE
jgi:site-specific DNA-methyltransferase (adenine-specific)